MEETSHHLVADVMLGGVVLLGAALLAVLIFRRLGLGAVLGYLVAGIAIGPDGLALIDSPETILAYSEIGILLVLFLVGLELSPSRLWLLRRDILLCGPLQVILCGLGMFAIIHFAMPSFSWQAALVLGLPLALSSTAQVLPLLQSRGRMKTDYGEKSFSILLFQDISIVPLLTIVAALSRAPAEDGAIEGWSLVLYAVLAIAGLVLAGRYLLSPLLRLVGKISERELFIVTGLFTVCVSAAVMQAIGVSPALGAFVAGVMLAESPYRHELEADIDPFRSILLGLFFLAVGMLLDVDVILSQPFFVAGLALALVAVKIAIIFALGRFFGLQNKPSFIMAMLLSQGSLSIFWANPLVGTITALAILMLVWPLWGRREAFYRHFARVVVAANIRPGTFRWLRRTAATQLERIEPGRGTELLGHASRSTTEQWYLDKSQLGTPPLPPL
jgi:monovalent cation:proton antiporter-2 (CPA2) family protein